MQARRNREKMNKILNENNQTHEKQNKLTEK